MTYRLSLLDKSPLPEGGTASEALARTVALAKKAEQLGYHRFWVAEHHDAPGLASSAPEVLIAFILANTARIRVGSGGVMLQHYSAYKVAEVFNLLASLAPGRVDLGVGKAPGGLPLSTRALQSLFDPKAKPAFNDHLTELDLFLSGGPAKPHPLAGVVATPTPPVAPERFLLGASVESALLAASRGWEFVYAGHLNGDPENLERSLSAFREASGGNSPVLALSAFAASSEEEARKRVSGLRIFKVHLATGQSVSVGSEDLAHEFARQSGVDDYRIEEKSPSILAGTAAQIREELERLHEVYGVKEFILEPPPVSAEERLASIELLATEKLSVAA